MNRAKAARARKARTNHAFVRWVRDRDCVGPGPHWGEVQAHHAGIKPGVSLKAPDDTCIPLCVTCHRHLEDKTGAFRGWSRADMRQWEDARIEETQHAWENEMVGERAMVPPRYEDRLLDLVIRARAIITAHAPCDCQDESETQSAIKCEHCIWLDDATREIA
jgi:hypothetical protein